MKKKGGLLKSLSICLVVVMLMAGAGVFLFAGENQGTQTGGKVEAAWDGQNLEEKKEEAVEQENNYSNADQEQEETVVEEEINQDDDQEKESNQTNDSAVSESTASKSADNENNNEEPEKEAEKEPEPAVAQNNNDTQADDKTNQEESNEPVEESQPVEDSTEQTVATFTPEAEEQEEEPKQEETKPEVQSLSTSAPVTYNWGKAADYTFRMEVAVTNNGSDVSRNVKVSVPLLNNSSPYQTTSLKSVNYDIISTSGRVSTFDLGDLAPGETKTIRADFDIRINSVSINSSNGTVEKALEAYEKHAGSGNCRTLARAFINELKGMGIEAREVIGFARPQRGDMTSGSLAGSRHSWAEFKVSGVGWFPVDLTFQYFGELPHTSHVVESYSDQSIKVNFSGGSLSATWSNLIL